MISTRRLAGICYCLFAFGAAAACSSSADPTPADRAIRTAGTELTATALGGGAVELKNTSGRRIFYLVVEPRFLGDWATCTDVANEWCHSVAPGATVRVQRAEIFGVSDSTRDVVVYWWDANVDTSSAEPAKSVRQVELTLGN